MPRSYTPFSGAAPSAVSELNSRFQEKEDYFLGFLAGTSAGHRWIEAEAGETLADRDAAYVLLADNKIYKMDSDAAGPKAGTIRGFVDGGVASGATARLVISGLMDGFSGLTAWDKVYAGTTAGGITQTRPSPALGGSQVMIAQMGYAVATDTVFVKPMPIQYQIRDAMALSDTATINHHADAMGYLRKTVAYNNVSELGASLVSYASSNQDSDVSLSDSDIATYGADQCSGGTATASSTSGTDTPSKAFDNNAANFWASNGKVAPQWLEYDFGTSKTVRKYTISSASAFATSMPTDWVVEYYDGATFQTADTRSGQSWTTSETKTFTISAAHTATRWRIRPTANAGGGNYMVQEMEMMEVATFTDGPSKLAQTFNLAGTEIIGAVGLWLKKLGSPTGTVTVRIETVAAGDPTGTLAHANATVTFAESSLGTSYAEKTVFFASAFSLAAGDYAIVISTSRAASEINYIDWGADGSAPAYAGGDMRTYSGSWASASKDAVFTVYEDGLHYPSWMKVGWWSSTFADLGARYGDGSGEDVDTETTFKCLRATGLDDVTVGVELL